MAHASRRRSELHREHDPEEVGDDNQRKAQQQEHGHLPTRRPKSVALRHLLHDQQAQDEGGDHQAEPHAPRVHGELLPVHPHAAVHRLHAPVHQRQHLPRPLGDQDPHMETEQGEEAPGERQVEDQRAEGDRVQPSHAGVYQVVQDGQCRREGPVVLAQGQVQQREHRRRDQV